MHLQRPIADLEHLRPRSPVIAQSVRDGTGVGCPSPHSLLGASAYGYQQFIHQQKGPAFCYEALSAVRRACSHANAKTRPF